MLKTVRDGLNINILLDDVIIASIHDNCGGDIIEYTLNMEGIIPIYVNYHFSYEEYVKYDDDLVALEMILWRDDEDIEPTLRAHMLSYINTSQTYDEMKESVLESFNELHDLIILLRKINTDINNYMNKTINPTRFSNTKKAQ
jgi:hypothetical protein